MEALGIVAVGIGCEEHPVGGERVAQLPQDARKLLRGDVEERGVGEDAVERAGGRSRARKLWCSTSQPVASRAIATKRAEPSSPTAS